MLTPIVQETYRAGGLRPREVSIAMPALPRLRRREKAAEHVLDPDTLGLHLDRLYRAAWALSGSAHEAEDLVQETYLKVLARTPTPRRHTRGRARAHAAPDRLWRHFLDSTPLLCVLPPKQAPRVSWNRSIAQL